MAATQYETQVRQYPVNGGQISTVGVPTQGTSTGATGVSWLAWLLPYVEQKPLYDQASISSPVLLRGIKRFTAWDIRMRQT